MLRRTLHHWRHFRPHRHRHRRYDKLYERRNHERDKEFAHAPEDVSYTLHDSDFYDAAERQVVSMVQRRPEVNDLDRHIDRLRKKFEHSRWAHDGMVALLAQVPRAVLAQLQMDEHPHGYRDKQQRLYELIDFNDTLDMIVIAMPPELRETFAERAKQAADRICKRVGAPCFSNEQWDAIIRGLSREIAVYMAARANGFNAVMPSRASDAMGVDVQVQDPESGRYINLDCKTPSAFRYRLEQLVKEDRISPHDQIKADEQSYWPVTNGHNRNRVYVILLCLLPDKFGEVENFEFVDSDAIRDTLNLLIRDYGLTDGRFGTM